MNIAVRYHTRTGNTEKIAKAIADELGTAAENLSAPLEEKVDILFLGSAVYAAGVDDEVKRFLKENKEKIGLVYNFSTAAALKSTYKAVKKIAAENGVALAEKEFHCRGKFLFMHGSHPNEEDLQNARQFAREALSLWTNTKD